MVDAYSSLPSGHLHGSVPAVSTEDKKPEATQGANESTRIFPTSNRGLQDPRSPYGGGGGEQALASWRRIFSISSYSPYFNVDTDVVLDRIISSVYPLHGDFFRKIDGNPDLYGPVWISMTLVFMLAALGNCATYLTHRNMDPSTEWNFDVTYVSRAACLIYGYLITLPTAFYFLLQYIGSNASLMCLWCLWGYSLFIFMPSSLLLVIPVDIFRWIITILAGSASASFVSSNLGSYTEGSDLMVLAVCAFLLQFFLAIFIKIFFFA